MPTHGELYDLVSATTERIYPSPEALQERLASGRPLRIYHGIDPTSAVLHLGHTVPLRLLRQFQERGHQAIVLIGDFTATVGDPSGRDRERSVLTREQVDTNVLALREQLGRVLDLARTELRFNSEWFDDPAGVGSLRAFLEQVGTRFTAAQLWERDLFQLRQAKQQPVSVTEFLYPTLQAYDSVALEADGEVGGSDQTFNMLAGRTLAKQLAGRDKFVLTTSLIAGTDGRKMSKSYGNTIGVTDAPTEMFGKLMSITDEQILLYMTRLTDRFVTGAQRAEYEQLVTEQPRAAKLTLAHELVLIYHGSVAADAAQQAWIGQFSEGAAPTAVPTVTLDAVPKDLAQLLVAIGAAASRSEAIRLVEQGGVTVNDQKQSAPLNPVVVASSQSLRVRVGPRHYFNVQLAA